MPGVAGVNDWSLGAQKKGNLHDKWKELLKKNRKSPERQETNNWGGGRSHPYEAGRNCRLIYVDVELQERRRRKKISWQAGRKKPIVDSQKSQKRGTETTFLDAKSSGREPVPCNERTEAVKKNRQERRRGKGR